MGGGGLGRKEGEEDAMRNGLDEEAFVLPKKEEESVLLDTVFLFSAHSETMMRLGLLRRYGGAGRGTGRNETSFTPSWGREQLQKERKKVGSCTGV